MKNVFLITIHHCIILTIKAFLREYFENVLSHAKNYNHVKCSQKVVKINNK